MLQMIFLLNALDYT